MNCQNEENNEPIISTQEMIQDARARRECNVKEFHCKKCDYKSSSTTLLDNHVKISHDNQRN